MSAHATQSAAAARSEAEQAFASGLYCAESVVLALARHHGVNSPLVPRMATAFCSGMARSCGPCGALTGALLGIGLILGRDAPGAPVEPAYRAAQRMIAAFEQAFGARDCAELLGCDLGTEAGQAIFRAQQLGVRCKRYTARAAELAADIIALEQAQT